VDGRVREREATPVDFDDWVEDRFVALLRFAYLVTGSQQAAEDALQSALERAFTRWDRVARTREPDSYVRRMVVNAHVDAWRRSGRHETAVDDVGAGAPDPSGDLAQRDALWRGCLRLPPRQRAALVLRFYEDLDYPEVAAVLGLAESTVRAHVHRGLAALRSTLAEEDPHGR
jgi:RNA polymerase sigma-70 factor (sigma-E family)